MEEPAIQLYSQEDDAIYHLAVGDDDCEEDVADDEGKAEKTRVKANLKKFMQSKGVDMSEGEWEAIQETAHFS